MTETMTDKLALFGGKPVLPNPIEFKGHDFGIDDINVISKVIKSGEIGTGPQVKAFETAYAKLSLAYGSFKQQKDIDKFLSKNNLFERTKF